MPLSKNKIVGAAITLSLLTVLTNTYYPKLFYFLVFASIGLISKYYKAVYAVSFLIIDLTDFFVILAFYKLGSTYAFALVPIFAYFYLVTGLYGNEGPTDCTSRFIGHLLNTLLLFYTAAVYPPATVFFIYILLAGLIWGTNQMLMFHIINPVYYPIAICRAALYWRVLPYLLPLIGLATIPP
ncbi:MAG: hypothetical protein ABH829_01705 [archaeon]